jgi:hypothetical protein
MSLRGAARAKHRATKQPCRLHIKRDEVASLRNLTYIPLAMTCFFIDD